MLLIYSEVCQLFVAMYAWMYMVNCSEIMAKMCRPIKNETSLSSGLFLKEEGSPYYLWIFYY